MLNAIVYKIVDLGPSKGGKRERHISVPDPEISFKMSLLQARDNENRKATMNFKPTYKLMTFLLHWLGSFLYIV